MGNFFELFQYLHEYAFELLNIIVGIPVKFNFAKNVIVTVDSRGLQHRWVPLNENNVQNVRRSVVYQPNSPSPRERPIRRNVHQTPRIVRWRTRPSVFEPQLQRLHYRYTANDRIDRYEERQRVRQLNREIQRSVEAQTRDQRAAENIPRLMMPRISILNMTTRQIAIINRNLSIRAENEDI